MLNLPKGVYIRTKEHRENISKSMKGIVWSKERNDHISQAMKGKPKSREHKEKLSDALRGRTLSKEHKQRISESNKGKILSKATRGKMSLAMKGRGKGEIANNSKTSREERKKIVELFLTGKYSESEIGAMFNLRQVNVSLIIVNKHF